MSVGSSRFVWVRVMTAWFGSFLQSAVHCDHSVHSVNAPVMACFSIDQEDKIFNHLCMVCAHRSFPLLSRFQRLEDWRRICPDESECRIFAPEVFLPCRRSRCKSPFSPNHQTQSVLNTQVRLICACLCIVTCAFYVSTRLLLQWRTQSS